jgi:23S rRNA (uracil1939-C5)-methyltransferase
MSSPSVSKTPRNSAVAAPVGQDGAVVAVESLDYDGRGVARVAGKVMFIEGALPGEVVRFRYRKKYKRYDIGELMEVLQPSPDRVAPACPYFGTCGGCRLQHLRTEAQVKAKQKIVAEHLRHIGKVRPERWLPPITGPVWAYRRRARLGVRLVPEKGGVIVGFREKQRSYITNLDDCMVLSPQASRLLPPLRNLVSQLTRPDQLPQIEVAVGEHAAALVFRHLEPLSPTDLNSLRAFGERHQIQIHLQPDGIESVHCLWPLQPPALTYRLTDVNVSLSFRPTDFIQVNAEINRKMVSQAVTLLDLRVNDQILELFCGLGNFTLPLARRVGRVLGIDAEEGMLALGRHNAATNDLMNAEFRPGDLYASEDSAIPWGDFVFQKLLLDPPRMGAMEALKRLPTPGPERILYVSCYPATLARDSQYLVQALGYRLQAAGVMDMFPHTSHVETMALFVKA